MIDSFNKKSIDKEESYSVGESIKPFLKNAKYFQVPTSKVQGHSVLPWPIKIRNGIAFLQTSEW